YSYLLPEKNISNIGTNTYAIETLNKCISTSLYFGRKNAYTQAEIVTLKKHVGTYTHDLCKRWDNWTWTGVPEEPVGAVDYERRPDILIQAEPGQETLDNPKETVEMDITASPFIVCRPEVVDIPSTPIFQISSIHRESEMESTITVLEDEDP
ncbi:Hypothetical predicted protein, partial [Pelobates cultripes]